MAFDAFVSAGLHTKLDMQTLALNEPLSASASVSDVDNHWERAKCKAQIMGHPMYDQLLEAHVACLRVATPVDQLSKIDDQLSISQEVFAKYSSLASSSSAAAEEELDHFMVTPLISILLSRLGFFFFLSFFFAPSYLSFLGHR